MERATARNCESKTFGIIDSVDSKVNEDIVYQCFIGKDVVDCDTSLESGSDFEEPEDG